MTLVATIIPFVLFVKGLNGIIRDGVDTEDILVLISCVVSMTIIIIESLNIAKQLT